MSSSNTLQPASNDAEPSGRSQPLSYDVTTFLRYACVARLMPFFDPDADMTCVLMTSSRGCEDKASDKHRQGGGLSTTTGSWQANAGDHDARQTAKPNSEQSKNRPTGQGTAWVTSA